MTHQTTVNGVALCARCAAAQGVTVEEWQNLIHHHTWSRCGGCGALTGCVDFDVHPLRVRDKVPHRAQRLLATALGTKH